MAEFYDAKLAFLPISLVAKEGHFTLASARKRIIVVGFRFNGQH